MTNHRHDHDLSMQLTYVQYKKKNTKRKKMGASRIPAKCPVHTYLNPLWASLNAICNRYQPQVRFILFIFHSNPGIFSDGLCRRACVPARVGADVIYNIFFIVLEKWRRAARKIRMLSGGLGFGGRHPAVHTKLGWKRGSRRARREEATYHKVSQGESFFFPTIKWVRVVCGARKSDVPIGQGVGPALAVAACGRRPCAKCGAWKNQSGLWW